ncbi:hypothetical protein ILUMI_18934, partial [Ignelater luminosus]
MTEILDSGQSAPVNVYPEERSRLPTWVLGLMAACILNGQLTNIDISTSHNCMVSTVDFIYTSIGKAFDAKHRPGGKVIVELLPEQVKTTPNMKTISQVRNSWMRTVAPVANLCVPVSGVKQKDLDEFYKYEKMPDDHSFKCYLLCNCLNLQVFDFEFKTLTRHLAQNYEYVEEEVADKFYKFGDMPDDPSFKCYLHCNALNLRIVDSTGQILPKHIVEIFDYTDLPLAEKCSKIIEADPCQRAYLMVKCFHNNLSERYS